MHKGRIGSSWMKVRVILSCVVGSNLGCERDWHIGERCENAKPVPIPQSRTKRQILISCPPISTGTLDHSSIILWRYASLSASLECLSSRTTFGCDLKHILTHHFYLVTLVQYPCNYVPFSWRGGYLQQQRTHSGYIEYTRSSSSYSCAVRYMSQLRDD